MIRLDLGCGTHKKEGFIGVDIAKIKGVDIIGSVDYLPIKDNAVDEIHTHFLLEHSNDVLVSMKELYRVCKNGAKLTLSVPYYNSPDSFRDPTHRSFFTERSMEYFTDGNDFGYYTNVRFAIENVEYGLTGTGKLIPPGLRLKVAHYVGNIVTRITWTLKAKK